MLSTAGLVVLIALVLCTIIQLVFILFVFGKLALYPTQLANANYSGPVSVIIAARNEYENLKLNLDGVLNQDYKEFEVIVVNDGSTDVSNYWLLNKEKEVEKLKVVLRKESAGSKKEAISEAIKNASYPVLLFTDADCKPSSKNWISKMVQHLDENKSICLGYGAYLKEEGILNKLIRLDTVFVATQYLSLALAKTPYMGVGRNLSYKKELWLDNDGFASHLNIKSGDDDLFVSEVASASNTAIEVNPESFTFSKPEKTFKAWILQKSRHLRTFGKYNGKTKWILNLYNISYLGFISMLILSFFVTLSASLSVSMYLMRLIPHIIVFAIIMNRLKEKDLIILTPILEPLLVFIYPFIILKSATTKTTIWK
ncbi:MAG: glycosyltransferase [Bacteroidia bacterium]|nr:glycosyltransferase [Bacteroidia bacterium]NNM16189.1 glycosyltransferase [Bacteroidia bacterium]